MVAHALNERLARRVNYLQEEVVLRQALATATGKSRLSFTPEQRARLALEGSQGRAAAQGGRHPQTRARAGARLPLGDPLRLRFLQRRTLGVFGTVRRTVSSSSS